ncbi:MAG: SnoaL-like domain-containing protein [Cyclobacteriaceae bacterium]
MTTQEVANKLVTYCREGKWEEAQKELYSQDIVSIEMEGQGFPAKSEGMDAIKAKGEKWEGMVEEFHGMEVSEPVVAGDHFSCSMVMDLKMKGRERAKDEEIALYKVKDGKIVSEQFFYSV